MSNPMVSQIILVDILLIALISFRRPCGARKNITQLIKYPPVLSVKPLNKVNLLYDSNRKRMTKITKNSFNSFVVCFPCFP